MNKIIMSIIGLVSIFSVSTATAGDVSGVKIDRDIINPNDVIIYNDLVLERGVKTDILVKGDGDGDIDYYLYDYGDHLIDSYIDSTDTCYLTVVPKWTGKFSLKLKNNGDESSVFTVIVR